MPLQSVFAARAFRIGFLGRLDAMKNPTVVSTGFRLRSGLQNTSRGVKQGLRAYGGSVFDGLGFSASAFEPLCLHGSQDLGPSNVVPSICGTNIALSW